PSGGRPRVHGRSTHRRYRGRRGYRRPGSPWPRSAEAAARPPGARASDRRPRWTVATRGTSDVGGSARDAGQCAGQHGSTIRRCRSPLLAPAGLDRLLELLDRVAQRLLLERAAERSRDPEADVDRLRAGGLGARAGGLEAIRPLDVLDVAL